ncbi:hypothetical protein ACJRW5_19540 [Pseudomonas sp. SH1-B]
MAKPKSLAIPFEDFTCMTHCVEKRLRAYCLIKAPWRGFPHHFKNRPSKEMSQAEA